MSNSNHYKKFIRPQQGELMELLKLNKSYQGGLGNMLWDETGCQFLEFTGSYGANTLGHGNHIRALASNFLMTNSTSFTQGSIRDESVKLASKMNELLAQETSSNDWNIQFSNSGAEAIEVALKVAKNSYQLNLQKIKIKYNEQVNKCIKYAQLEKDLILQERLINLKQENQAIFESPSKTLCIENCFHGKTNEALKITHNKSLKNDIIQPLEEVNIIRVKRNDVLDLTLKVEQNKVYIKIPKIINNELVIEKTALYKISSFIIEPIQGEAGIYELEKTFLEALRAKSSRVEALLIFDEIQSGSYRTGVLCSASIHEVDADVYVFGKGLSAGFAKIALTCTNAKKFPLGFDMVHSSTYAEDDLSSFVALEALTSAKEFYAKKQEQISYLREQLDLLKSDFPGLISEIRGRGLMLVVELSESVRLHSYEFKYFSDCNVLGHLISSALLNNGKLRVAPTLSNQMAFRVQPSLELKNYETLLFCNGFRTMLNAIKDGNAQYFFGHVLENQKLGQFNLLSEDIRLRITRKYKNPAVFLNHPIENKDVKEILTVFKNVDDLTLENLMELTFDLQSFSPYYSERIIGDNGKVIDIVMLSIPVTSKILFKKFRSKSMNQVVQKIQEGVNIAASYGASTVGLGQFTSIVSKNGSFLDNLDMNLTTGNSFTAKLAYDAGVKSIDCKLDTTIGLVGYGGNIISSIANLAMVNAKKVILFHRNEELYPKRVKVLFEELISYIAKTKDQSVLITAVKHILENKSDHSISAFSDFIEISNDLSRLNECDLIYTGTNTTRPIIIESQLKENCTLVDLAVPGDFDTSTISKNSSIRIIRGGIAQFPKKNNQEIDIKIPSFPLNPHESFACMAETFALGLSNCKGLLNVGPINIEDIKSISSMAEIAGFTLACDKQSKSM